MLIEIYIEALLVDEDLADQVWEIWNGSIVSIEQAAIDWWIVATVRSGQATLCKI